MSDESEDIVDRLREEGKIKPLEVRVSASVGGKVQVVKFEYTEDFHYSQGATYSTEGLTEEEADALKEVMTRKIKDDLEPIAQEQVDKLIAMRDAIRNGEAVLPDPVGPSS